MKEIRIIPVIAEKRADDPAGKESLYIKGVPIIYDTPTVINDPAGSYTEIIRSGALDGADISDARLMYNHDLNKVPLARTPKTMQLERSAAGLSMIAELPDTEDAKSVHTAVTSLFIRGSYGLMFGNYPKKNFMPPQHYKIKKKRFLL